jgi:histidyl-tRNA synthetase
MAATGPVQGMRDFTPLEVRRRRYLIERFSAVYERYGFDPIDTPVLERLEVLLGKGGDENEKLIFKVQKRGASFERAREAGEELADAGLRFDLTVPLARYAVEHRAELPRVFRRYHIGPVWRADRPARGRFREFYQCDVDIVGSDSPSAEVEVILATADALEAVGFGAFSVKLNDRRLLGALLGALGVPTEQHASAVVALDKMDKIGLDGVAAELAERGVPPQAVERLRGFDLGRIASALPLEGLDAFAAELTGLGASVSETSAVLDNLRTIVRDISGARSGTAGPLTLKIDPLLARCMGYYTCPIFEIASAEMPLALGGGGLYDWLVARFGKEQIPAVGFSIGFERVLLLMTENRRFPETLGGLDAYVTVFSADDRAASLAMADRLRRAGLSVLMSLSSSGLKGQLKEANDRGARVTLIAGPSEREQGVVQVKHMATGDAVMVPVPELESKVKALSVS